MQTKYTCTTVYRAPPRRQHCPPGCASTYGNTGSPHRDPALPASSDLKNPTFFGERDQNAAAIGGIHRRRRRGAESILPGLDGAPKTTRSIWPALRIYQGIAKRSTPKITLRPGWIIPRLTEFQLDIANRYGTDGNGRAGTAGAVQHHTHKLQTSDRRTACDESKIRKGYHSDGGDITSSIPGSTFTPWPPAFNLARTAISGQALTARSPLAGHRRKQMVLREGRSRLH